jgi:hypothetical protein
LKYCMFQFWGDSVTPSSEMNSPATIFRICAPPSLRTPPPYAAARPPNSPRNGRSP